MSDENRTSDNNKREAKNVKNKKTSKKSDLDLTTRIRIDQERLDDSDSLDTSFLEGRISRQVRKNKKSKEKLLKSSIDRRMADVPIKKIVLLALLASIIISILIFLPSIKFSSPSNENKKDSDTKEEKVEKIIDDNYLFVGDFHTDELDLEELSLPCVKISDKEYKTSDILDNMKEKIYQYNPSVVIIELGINDLSEEESSDDIISHISEIIDGIKENRPYAEIYLESIYPINRDVEKYDDDILSNSFDDNDIFSINIELKKLAKKKDILYLDVYDKIGEKKQLKSDYTDDGIHLNEEGYKEVLSLIEKVVGDVK